MAIRIRNQFRPSVEHGVNDSLFANRILPTQAAKAINFDMTEDGKLESRGGSIKLTDTTVGASTDVQLVHDYITRDASGTVTHNTMIKAGTVVYKYNSSTGVFDSVQTGLSTNKPSMVNFINNAGSEVVLYADGENFASYDGTTWSDITGNFNAATGRDKPRYLLIKHDVCWASGDDTNPDIVYFSPPLAPDTDWGSNDWVRISGGLDKVTGLNEMYDYIVVGALRSMHIIIGRVSADFSPLQVSSEIGTTSHWSIVAEGSHLYFANPNGIHIGRLRAAEDDALEVEPISINMQNTYKDIADGAWDNIEGKYFEPKRQIYWTYRSTDDSADPDRMLVYSTSRSSPDFAKPDSGPDPRFVWAGYHKGLNYLSIGIIADSNGKETLYVGGNDGNVYALYSGHKDKRAVGVTTGTDVAYEIRSREETFGGTAQTARVVNFLPTLYQKHNGGTSVQYIIDRSKLLPATARAIRFTGNIPYWNGGTQANITTQWGSSIWSKKPVIAAKVRVGKLAHSIIFIITSDGSNAQEEITWVGYDLGLQMMRNVRGKDT